MSGGEQQGTTFSWIPIYAELAKKILEYRDRQTSLIQMLKELQGKGVSVIALRDRDENRKDIALNEIDPFTFFASFNRTTTNENRRATLEFIKNEIKLQAEVPKDFSGVPVVTPLAAWFFPYKGKRGKNDIRDLWLLAEAVITGPPQTLDAQLYERCLRIRGVAPAKLTIGMFWLNPRQYIAWDANNQGLFRDNNIGGDPRTLAGYLQLLSEVAEKLGTDYPRLSFKAWQKTKPTEPAEKGYWAGGFRWGTTSKLNDFTTGDFWQVGWKRNEKNRAAKKTWTLFDQIKVGDEFAIKGYGHRNVLHIHYIGEVETKTDDGILKLKKLSRQLYKGQGPKGLRGTSWFDTLVQVNSEPIINTIFRGKAQADESAAPLTKTEEEPPLNLVLYGPPGTGKTYQTVDRAVTIVDSRVFEDRVSRKARFDELLAQGRIEVVTFHQSYSYEDFVEGIRPVLGHEEQSPRYECRPGTFKRLALSALFDCLEGIHNTNMPNSAAERTQVVHRYLVEGEKSGYKLKPRHQWNRYVLIIDEINRGNISKILGELITLIETDKRIQDHANENSLTVTLPYSGEKFAVPGNLYILATMNTADKSIALVDIALRRRFEFEELAVQFSVCKGLTDKMRSILEQLNRRIVLRKDRDHQIGHAFFIDVADELTFNARFRRQIIPLLQEYFYNDWEGLRFVLGEPSEGAFILKVSGSEAKEARTRWQWFFDAGQTELDCLSTLCSNYKEPV